MKTRIYNILSKPYIVVLTMLLAAFFSYFDRNYGYFFGMFVAGTLLWSGNFKWANFGFGTRLSLKTVWRAFLLSLLIFFVIDICIQPFLEIYFGPIDLSSIDEIRGDFASYAILMMIMWIFAAFGEEFLFSGYYMKHLAETLGDTDRAWLISLIVLSMYFGVSHNYQGPAGMIAVGLASVFYFFTFYKNRANLVLLVFMHGFYDTIGLTLIYLNQDRAFYDWALGFISDW